jgi:hypothetical protein
VVKKKFNIHIVLHPKLRQKPPKQLNNLKNIKQTKKNFINE